MKPMLNNKEQGAKEAHHFWGIAFFVHRLNNIKALMKKILHKDSVEYDLENLRFSIVSFEKHFHMLRRKFYDLERRMKDTGRVNYTICPKCGGRNYEKK